MTDMSLRIARLRQAALDKAVPRTISQEDDLNRCRGWQKNADSPSCTVRQALARYEMLTQATPVIDADELIVGKPCFRDLTNAEQEELARFHKDLMPIFPRLGGQDSHMAMDYEKLLTLGGEGVRREVEAHLADLDVRDGRLLEHEAFYQACLIALDGMMVYAKNYAAHARTLSKAADTARAAELELIAQTLEQVPAKPARTFREALQSVIFLTISVRGGLYQLGRPDRYLLPYYENDLRSGILTESQAQELIDCACLMLNEFIPRGLAVGFMVGGRDAKGCDITNALTRMFLHSISHTRLVYPGIGLCVTSDTPDDVLALSCQLLGQGLSHPALFNDETITNGLLSYGLPIEQACLYVLSTCVEITPIASSAVWVASPYINLAQALLDVLGVPALGSGEAPVKMPTFASMQALEEAFLARLKAKLTQELTYQNRLQMERARHGGHALVSCFVNDCLSRGKDVDEGGARYNWIMPSFVGVSNLADAFTAIRQLVFEKRQLTLDAFVRALLDNFKGHEALLGMVANKVPKYGNDEAEPDEYVSRITRWIEDLTRPFTTYRGDRVIPSLFCWEMHERLGRETAATPDGRLAGEALGDGSGPAQGRERSGPTASILSATKWRHEPFIGGIAVNMKFAKSLFSPTSQAKMQALISAFLERGGFEMQVNVVDRSAMEDALVHPENHRDLIVRVGGYSDYFVNLSPQMQREVMLRSEHAI